MDDEIIVENSPLHKYLLEIGMNDIEVVKPIRESPVPPSVTPLTMQSRIWTLIGHLQGLSSQIVQYQSENFFNYCESVLVTDHFEDLLIRFERVVYPISITPAWLHIGGMHMFCLVLICLLISVIRSTILNTLCCILIGSLLMFKLIIKYCQYTKQQYAHMLSTYVRSLKSFKSKVKKAISFIRDCQTSKTLSVSGVTWNKLDALEKSEVLVLVELRSSLLNILQELFQLHKTVVIKSIVNFPMIGELDIRGRYIAFEDIGNSEDLSCLSLRYYFKLFEHISSEVLWRLIIGNKKESWQSSSIPFRYPKFVIKSLHGIDIPSFERSLDYCYQVHQDNLQCSITSNLARTIEDTSRLMIRVELNSIISSLNIFKSRCLDVLDSVSSSEEPLSDSEMNRLLGFVELSKLSSDSIIQSLDKLSDNLRPKQNIDTQATLDSGRNEICGGVDRKDVPLIIPYQQKGNLVFEGVSMDHDGSGDSEDDDYHMNLASHKKVSKLLMVELKHTIESNPTTLYDNDYQEMKRAGQVNPLKKDLLGASDFIEESQNRSRALGFNPIQMGLPSIHQELLDVGETFGDVSEEEQEEGELYLE